MTSRNIMATALWVNTRQGTEMFAATGGMEMFAQSAQAESKVSFEARQPVHPGKAAALEITVNADTPTEVFPGITACTSGC